MNAVESHLPAIDYISEWLVVMDDEEEEEVLNWVGRPGFFWNRFIETGSAFEPENWFQNCFFNKTGSKTELIPINRFKNGTGSDKPV